MNNLAYTPFFSIVIANYNYGRFLEDAICSLLEQSCQDFELIIVDGGSSDNSVEIIRAFSDRLGGVQFGGKGLFDHLVVEKKSVTASASVKPADNFRTLELQNSRIRFLWCSEKDRGQSHAFNKGFAKAKGLFLTWLNADDMLTPGTLAAAKRKLLKHPECRWMTGNGFRFTEDGKVVECRWGPWCMPKLFQRPHAPVAVFGPTSFFSRDLYLQVGGLDESLHYVMDTDLWMRFMALGVPYLRLNRYCWAFRMHAMSKTAEYGEHQLEHGDKTRLQAEGRYACEKDKYHYSICLHVLHKVWRWLTLSEVKSHYMSIRWISRDIKSFLAATCPG